MKYLLTLHPSGKFLTSFEKQIKTINKAVYHKDTTTIIYRVVTKETHDNPRKLFFSGKGNSIELEIPPHITLLHTFEFEETKEKNLITRIEEVTKKANVFTLKPQSIGDYHENFTVFVSFDYPVGIEKLQKNLEKAIQHETIYKASYIPHATIVYDDTTETNIDKARLLLKPKELLQYDLPINTLWLWKNKPFWQPYREYNLG